VRAAADASPYARLLESDANDTLNVSPPQSKIGRFARSTVPNQSLVADLKAFAGVYAFGDISRPDRRSRASRCRGHTQDNQDRNYRELGSYWRSVAI